MARCRAARGHTLHRVECGLELCSRRRTIVCTRVGVVVVASDIPRFRDRDLTDSGAELDVAFARHQELVLLTRLSFRWNWEFWGAAQVPPTTSSQSQ